MASGDGVVVRTFPPWLKPHRQQGMDGGTEVPPLQSKDNNRLRNTSPAPRRNSQITFLTWLLGYSRRSKLKAVALTADNPPCRAKNARRGWGTRQQITCILGSTNAGVLRLRLRMTAKDQ